MAFTQPLSVSVTLQDALGVPASTEIFGNTDSAANTVADLVTAAQDWLTEINNVSDAQIIGGTLKIALDTSTFTDPPASDSEVERGGLLNFRQTGSKYKYGYLIPALKEAAIVNGKINLADAGIAALIATLIDATPGVIQFRSPYQLVLPSLADALIVFRKHRRLEDKRSYEVG